MASFVAHDRGPLSESRTFLRGEAGAEANVAVALARLGHGVVYIGRVGEDGLGAAIARRLRGEGVDVSYLTIDEAASTGVMVRELRDLGPSEVVYWRAGSAGSRLGPDDVDAALERFRSARWLHLTGITPALSNDAAGAVERAVELASEASLTISLDLNVRRRLWDEATAAAALARLAGRVDVVMGSLEEVALVAGLASSLRAGAAADPERAADALLAIGPRSVVVKLGAQGGLERSTDGAGATTVRRPAYPVQQVVDPVGAGDAFSAAWIAFRLEGRGPEEALRAANACGAAVISSVGDQAGIPTRAELDRLLEGGGPDTLR
jgi:2-dehydro-3-deoxygluconokinase